MVFKKDLTPIGKGGITKHRGKGATEQRVPRGMMDTVSGPATIGRALNRYPKPAPPAPAPGPDMGPMPPPGPLPPEQ
jgi:hypothetical protein